MNILKPNLTISLDIGHASIGWAVLSNENVFPKILGTGSVVFRSNDCLNINRASFRRSRRNIAAKRNRIKHLKALLTDIGALSEAELNQHPRPHPFPWLLAAQVLRGERILSWNELWSVILWYAHNRGYDGNALWSDVDESDDTEKVTRARDMMHEYDASSMAETICAYLDVDPKSKKNPNLRKYFKGENLAFPRDVIEEEVFGILTVHIGKLRGCTDAFLRCLLEDAGAISCSGIRLPQRFKGGLLFGQMVPRFDNRIIPTCRFSGEKTPSKHCREYYRYRWGMLLSNIRVKDRTTKEIRSLSATERLAVHAEMEKKGYFSKTELIKVIESLGNCEPINLETMFLIPEMEKALVFNPAKREIYASEKLKKLWGHIPAKWQSIFGSDLHKERKVGDKRPTLANWLKRMQEDGVDLDAFNEQLSAQIENEAVKASKKKKKTVFKRGEYLNKPIKLSQKASGRAPYARSKMQEAWEAVFDKNKPDPKDSGGCLEETAAVLLKQVEQSITDKTNNHLVRHRLLILERLLHDIVKNYADGDVSRIVCVSLEVIRDIQEFSGKNAKEKVQHFGLKLASHRKAVNYLERIRAEEDLDFTINAGLIKKVRIAQDMGWKCPFTQELYGLQDILGGDIDKEHVIPRALRPSDSLESLVLTFRNINAWKGRRTGLQFIVEEQSSGKLVTPAQYKKFVEKLKPSGSSLDDKKRCARRKALLLTEHFDKRKANQNAEGEEVGGFTGRDLTQTSHLNKLAALTAQKTLGIAREKILHLPGSVTAAIRKSWDLTGTLAKANPQVLDESGKAKIKGDIREITHLHHALDALTLAYAASLFPKNGNLWEFMCRRTLREHERRQFKKLCPHSVTFNDKGQWRMQDLSADTKAEIADALAAKRVVMHMPKTMSGLKVEQNTWGVIMPEDPEKLEGKIRIKQTIRNGDGRLERKEKTEKASRLLGYRTDKKDGKLQKISGALIVDQNFGVALDPKPKVIPFIRVWETVEAITQANNGKPPRILRIGNLISVPQGRYQGTWRVRSIKDEKVGITLDMSHTDKINVETKGIGSKRSIRINTLMKDGMTVLNTDYTAHPIK